MFARLATRSAMAPLRCYHSVSSVCDAMSRNIASKTSMIKGTYYALIGIGGVFGGLLGVKHGVSEATHCASTIEQAMFFGVPSAIALGSVGVMVGATAVAAFPFTCYVYKLNKDKPFTGGYLF